MLLPPQGCTTTPSSLVFMRRGSYHTYHTPGPALNSCSFCFKHSGIKTPNRWHRDNGTAACERMRLESPTSQHIPKLTGNKDPR